MKILHTTGFSQLDLANYRYLIIANVLESVQQLIEGARRLQIPADSFRLQADIDLFNLWLPKAHFGEVELACEFGRAVARIVRSEMARATLSRREDISLLDSADFFSRLDVISAPFYIPSNEDVLRSRAATTGIVEMEFVVDDRVLRMIDVGGQRSERRKWIHCFDSVDGLLFIADLSGYNQKIDPSEATTSDRHTDAAAQAAQQKAALRHRWNRLKYNMDIFDSVASNGFFTQRTALIVFLNKADIFAAKLATFPMSICFRDYKGDSSFDDAIEYVGGRFRRLVVAGKQQQQRLLYVHTTTATDTNAVRVVFTSCLDVIVQNALKRMGMT